MKKNEIINHIVTWLDNYCTDSFQQGYIVGISGGIDSALTSTLCAMTGKKVIAVSLPLRQKKNEYDRATKHIEYLTNKFSNVSKLEIDLSSTFEELERNIPIDVHNNKLAMANTRSRLRMTTLYAIGQSNQLLVAGTGNKIEDFGVGFFTKYGDGGVDVSPIADLTKTEVRNLSSYLQLNQSILEAEPTDGLWDEEGRTDENQIGANYPELEWAMEYKGKEENLTEREKEVLKIYRKFNSINQHKMIAIPVCKIPTDYK